LTYLALTSTKFGSATRRIGGVSSRPVRLPELSEIQTFVLAVELGSISSASKRLRISAAAATKRLNNLDALSPGKLLERTSHGVQVTPLGRRLLPGARRLIRDAEMLFGGPAEHRPCPLRGIQRILGRVGSRSLPDERVADLETLLACVFSAASDPLLISDSEGVVIDANAAYCRLTGRERDAVVGRPVPGLELALACVGIDTNGSHGWSPQPAGITMLGHVRTSEGELRTVTYSLHRVEVAQVPLSLIRVSQPDRSHATPSCRSRPSAASA
jgi:PAS domain S-box-containing protein